MSEMTQLGLSGAAQMKKELDGRCPRCQAERKHRQDASNFGGGPRVVLCGMCGYEFQEDEHERE